MKYNIKTEEIDGSPEEVIKFVSLLKNKNVDKSQTVKPKVFNVNGSRKHQRWTAEDERFLEEAYQSGRKVKRIARELKRDRKSVV